MSDRFERYGQHYLRELAASKKAQEKWATAADTAWKVFKNDGDNLGAGIESLNAAPARVKNFLRTKALNLLWVVVESQLAHIYSQKPKPMLRRRSGRPNPAEDFAAKMLEKCLTVALDDEENDPHRVFKRVTKDMAVGGWGWAEVCYEPEMELMRDPIPVVLEDEEWRDPAGAVVPAAMVTIDEENPEDGTYQPDPPGTEDDGEGEEELPDALPERTFLRYVGPHRTLCHNAEVWEEVEWVATCETPTRRELEERWDPETIVRVRFHDEPEEGATPTASEGPDDATDMEPQPWDRAKLWRVFDRVNRNIVWIDDRSFERMRRGRSEDSAFTQGVEDPQPGNMIVEIEDDELGLTGFFPFPEPLGTVMTSRSVIPTPEFMQFEAVFMMIQETVIQYFFLIRAIMVKGLVAGGKKKLVEDMLNSAPWVQVFAATDAGPQAVNIDQWLHWFPVENVVNAANNIQNIIGALERLMYEIAGSPDTMRGVAHHRASPTVERQKATIGSGRLAMKKDMVEQFARSVLRMMTEVMSNHFELSTLEEMSGMVSRPRDAIKKDLAQTQQELDQLRQQAKQAQEQDAEPEEIPDPAPVAERLAKLKREPSREAVMDVLRKRWRRHFAVDIETDSTLLPDQQMEREQRMQMLESLTRALGALSQLAEAKVIGAPTLGKLIAALIETLPMTRELAEELRTFVPPKPPPAPDPEKTKQETALQLAREKREFDQVNEPARRQNALEIARVRAGTATHQTDTSADLKREELEIQRLELIVRDMVGKVREHISAERAKDRVAAAAAKQPPAAKKKPTRKKAAKKAR